ncbi:MAG: glycosyltransferase, partial [Candidatus Hodarchaeota archaeon]
TVLHNDLKLGRGRAVKRAMKLFDAEIYAYFDVDLASDMMFFPTLINKVKMGYDIVTGSRYTRGATFCRPLLRLIASRVYNWMVRFLFHSPVYDHQCGFKAFSRRVRDELLGKCKSDDWLWDTEIIVLGARSNFEIHEFPVEWRERRFRNTPLRRLIADVKIHGIGLLKLYSRINSRGGSIRS